jgi:uncharacterized protein (DUF58 family)
MTSRLLAILGVLVFTAVSALSLGGPLFYLIALTLLAMILYGLISAWLNLLLTAVTQTLSDTKLERGGEASLDISLVTKSPLPAGPLFMRLSLPDGAAQTMMYPGFLKPRTARVPLRFPHVGIWRCGADRVLFTDIFGLFRFKKQLKQGEREMMVLPRGFEVQPLVFAHMDDIRALPNQAGEDITSPEDTRAYREGDPFKRIHWKLSLRNRELVVRRFEVPSPPDTLILMDCTDPLGVDTEPDGMLRLRDTLCETALAVAAMQIGGEHPIRLPLYGARQSEFRADRALSLSLLKEELACQLFRGGEPFDKVLSLELRRMRRTGATIVITTRLDAQVVEGINNIRASGPSVRFYLITFAPGDERYAPYIARLQQHLVEVCYVTPP